MWIVNTTDRNIEVLERSLHKWITFKPGIPLEIDSFIGREILDRFSSLRRTNNPDAYLKGRKLKQVIVRDAGIGDLLLLEPPIRELVKQKGREIYVVCAYPEVYENHPHIHEVVKMETKNDIGVIRKIDFDCYEDLRSYSETAPTRSRKHRTLVYNEKIGVKLNDPEPKLYFSKSEKSVLKKKSGYKYIGVSVEASHKYRGYADEGGLVDYLINADKKNIVVLLGNISKGTYKHKRVFDFKGKTKLRESFLIIRDLDYMISVDSGLMHVALTLHIPTVCIFTIISPQYRVAYYTGKKAIVQKENLDCLGCGDHHMADCRKNTKREPNHIGPCQTVAPEKIYQSMISLGADKPVINYTEKKEIPNIRILKKEPSKKLTMPIIVQDEEKNLPRFIENVMKHPCIGRVIAIDGGSKDKTVSLLEKAGAEVYHHPYIKNYHDMQAMQRNISCSYVADGTNILIMDIDECFSDELSNYLYELAESNHEYGLVSRRTFNYYADIGYPERQIKDYPDFQPRFYKWNRRFKFVGGAHHVTLNTPPPVKIQKDIIHFEREGKDREAMEKQWSNMMKGVRKYA